MNYEQLKKEMNKVDKQIAEGVAFRNRFLRYQEEKRQRQGVNNWEVYKRPEGSNKQ